MRLFATGRHAAYESRLGQHYGQDGAERRVVVHDQHTNATRGRQRVGRRFAGFFGSRDMVSDGHVAFPISVDRSVRCFAAAPETALRWPLGHRRSRAPIALLQNPLSRLLDETETIERNVSGAFLGTNHTRFADRLIRSLDDVNLNE